jgi:hypothetical protein
VRVDIGGHEEDPVGWVVARGELVGWVERKRNPSNHRKDVKER